MLFLVMVKVSPTKLEISFSSPKVKLIFVSLPYTCKMATTLRYIHSKSIMSMSQVSNRDRTRAQGWIFKSMSVTATADATATASSANKTRIFK